MKNCRILTGSGNWTNGISSLASGVAKTTHVQNNYIENPSSYGIGLGDHIERNVIKNAGLACLGSAFFPGVVTFLSGAVIENNYCSSANLGLVAGGPASGTALDVHDNYIRAVNDGILQDGLTTFEENIVQGSPTWSVSNPGGATFTNNFCDDPTYCDDPTDAPFAMTLTIH